MGDDVRPVAVKSAARAEGGGGAGAGGPVPSGEGGPPVRATGDEGLVRRTVARVTAELERLDGLVQARRQHSPVVQALFDMHELDRNVGGGILAGAVAYRLFLFMVPFVYVVFTLLGFAGDVATKDPADLAKSVGITGVLGHAVVSTHELKTGTQILLLVGATYALLHTARSLVKALFAVHTLVWRVPRVKLKGMKPVFTFIGIVTVMALIVPLLDRLRNKAYGAGAVVAILLVTSISFVIWWWVSGHLPHAGVPAWALIPGALLIAVGVEALHALTVYWISSEVSKKSETYGTVGIALTVLLWTYLLGRLIVASAGINATLWRRYEARAVAHRAGRDEA